MTRLVLLDNTVLSNFAVVGRMDLAFQLYANRVVTTQGVMHEYQVAVAAGLLARRAWDDLTVVEMTSEELVLCETLAPRLGIGERTCLAVAHARGGLFVSDDGDARAAAKRLDVPVSGTVGILVLAVRLEYATLAEANALLIEMIAAGYRSPLRVLDTLV